MFNSNDLLIGRVCGPYDYIDTTTGFISMNTRGVHILHNETAIGSAFEFEKIIGAAALDNILYILYKNEGNVFLYKLDSDTEESITETLFLKYHENMNIYITDFGVCVNSETSLYYLNYDNKINVKRKVDIKGDISFVYTCTDFDVAVIKNSKRLVKIYSDSTQESVINMPHLFNKPNIIRGGNKDNKQEYGICSLFCDGVNLYFIDALDDLYVEIENMHVDDNKSITLIDSFVYVYCEHGLFLLNNYGELEKINTNIIGAGTIYSSKRDLYIKNNTNNYMLDKANDVAVISIYGVNNASEIIGMKDIVVLKEGKISINAPSFGGYVCVGDNIKTITTSKEEDFYEVFFDYGIGKTTYKLSVTYKTITQELYRDEFNYLDGEYYNVDIKNISGYSFSHGVNSSGYIDRDINCSMIYTDSISADCFVNLSVNGAQQITVPVLVEKGASTYLTPSINYHEKSVVTSSYNSSYDISFDSLEYTPTHKNIKKIRFTHGGEVLYEDYALVEGFLKVINNPFIKPVMDNIPTDVTDIECKSLATIYLLKLIDMHDDTILFRYMSQNQYSKSLTLYNYSFKKVEIKDKGSIVITNAYYQKIYSKITIIHKTYSGDILNSITLTGIVGSSYTVTPVESEYIPDFENTDIKYSHEDREHIFYYKEKTINVTYNYRDMSGKLFDTQVFHLSFDQKAIEPKYKYILSFVPSMLTHSAAYDIFVDLDYTPSISVKGYSSGLVTLETSNSRKLIAMAGSVEANNKVYVLNPISTSLKEYLKKNNIEYSLTDTIISNGILLNGDYNLGTKKQIDEEDISDNVLYIPAGPLYKDLAETIKLAMVSCISEINIPIVKSKVDGKYEAKPKRAISSKEAKIECTFIPNISMEQVVIDFINPITNEIVTSVKYSYSPVSSFKNIKYTIDNKNYESNDGTINVKSENYIVAKDIIMSFKDEVGNYTDDIEDYLYFFTKNITTAQEGPNRMVSVARINNRFKGVKESLKYINFYDGIEKAIKNIEEMMVDK